ncbi:hypothetical protein IW261DRAFT_1597633 [Armillaria novae-zelandiae]|uniref:Uncharacterized protein n=1 Tax=Armillaria novae-zelandiae TaxID=153914 RepID=A0AA39NSC3_9AGAR|nr:hypothetical protein IW261DRAFT_1597633 [Armillaria novae-zelandiae]
MRLLMLRVTDRGNRSLCCHYAGLLHVGSLPPTCIHLAFTSLSCCVPLKTRRCLVVAMGGECLKGDVWQWRRVWHDHAILSPVTLDLILGFISVLRPSMLNFCGEGARSVVNQLILSRHDVSTSGEHSQRGSHWA